MERLTCFEESSVFTIRQTRRGWLQECCGCEAKTEFKWFDTSDGKTDYVATSLERSGCCIRILCGGNQPFKMSAKDSNDVELLSMNRPLKCPAGPCKCCCYQEINVSSGDKPLGGMVEQFSCCVPRFIISDSNGKSLYKAHMPTCCGGMCYNCTTEGMTCGRACCVIPYHIFPADQAETDNGADPIGKIVSRPKSLLTEIFTDANVFDVYFPAEANAEQKALVCGTAILLNAIMDSEETN